jgi:Trk-type K+ transport system membrane component
MGFVADPWVALALVAALVLGGLGFPVLREVARMPCTPERWTIHTRLTLVVTAGLFAAGIAAVLWFEWSNPRTLGPLATPVKVLAAVFQGTNPRTAGFNSVDYAGMNEATLLVTDVLMFIGGGSASTAGGIKVTTFAVLGLMIWAEARGDPLVAIGGRTIPATAQRQALAVAALGLGVIVVATLVLVLVAVSGLGLSRLLFEAFSAFATVGLSTGITASLPPSGQLVLVVLMFLGRTGPLTLGAALALRSRERLYRHPEERPIIG